MIQVLRLHFVVCSLHCWTGKVVWKDLVPRPQGKSAVFMVPEARGNEDTETEDAKSLAKEPDWISDSQPEAGDQRGGTESMTGGQEPADPAAPGHMKPELWASRAPSSRPEE